MPTSLVILTGAGISADSGVCTFRDADGLWENHRLEDVATPEAWAGNPELVWRFYQGRRAQLGSVAPNAAHLHLATWTEAQRARGHTVTLITQNVDDLHERAGSTPLHMHGELLALRCERCGAGKRGLDDLDPERFVACVACGHERLRPDIVWFGEIPHHLDQIESALQQCTHFIAIGTSGLVYPAASMLQVARANGATTRVQSLQKPHNLHFADRFVAGRAAEVVPGMLDQIAADVGR